MDIAQKYRIVEKIIQSNDDILLNEINSLISSSENDFWDTLSADVKQSIGSAKIELDEGRGVPHNQVMKEIKDRYLI